MRGRAETPEAKRKIVDRVLAAWLQVPEQRLTQFIVNAAGNVDGDVFHVEDVDVARACEAYAAQHR